MAIEQIEAFQYKGRVFTEHSKAVDYAESLVHELLRNALVGKSNFTLSDVVRITEAVLANRARLMQLLDY